MVAEMDSHFLLIIIYNFMDNIKMIKKMVNFLENFKIKFKLDNFMMINF